jgi:hypothetical protein
MFDTATSCDDPRSLADVLATRNVEIFTLVLQSHGFSYREPGPETPAQVGCHGCSWTHGAADQDTAQRLHALHIIEVLRANWVAVDVMDGDVATSDYFGHFDRIADTGEGYEILGRKHAIRCIWCGMIFLGETPEEAESVYRRHEDRLRLIDNAQRSWAHTGVGDALLRLRDSYLPHNYWPRTTYTSEVMTHHKDR